MKKITRGLKTTTFSVLLLTPQKDKTMLSEHHIKEQLDAM